MKATCIAPSNIAFVKYWGKVDKNLRLPSNDSLSMNLSGATTTTTVEFSSRYPQDSIHLSNGVFTSEEKDKIVAHLNRMRTLANISYGAKVVTKNSFPKGTGIASSASGFAALTVAGTRAIGLVLSEKDLTVLARLGSGSACRSIPDGFVLWDDGTSSDTSFAHSIFPSDWWDICDILVVVQQKEKHISSTDGMDRASTSPFWRERLRGMKEKLSQTKDAIQKKNIHMLGELIEEECFAMHAVMMSQKPPLFYINDDTVAIIQFVFALRGQGIPVYVTLDAGPNVHCICEKKYASDVMKHIRKVTNNTFTMIINYPSVGARVTREHLF